jgi:hypothetical protein
MPPESGGFVELQKDKSFGGKNIETIILERFGPLRPVRYGVR